MNYYQVCRRASTYTMIHLTSVHDITLPSWLHSVTLFSDYTRFRLTHENQGIPERYLQRPSAISQGIVHRYLRTVRKPRIYFSHMTSLNFNAAMDLQFVTTEQSATIEI